MSAADKLPPGAREIEGVWVWPDPQKAGRFHYLPSTPSPALTPDGRPQMSAVLTGGRLILSLAATLTLSPAAQAAIVAALRTGRDPAISTVDLQPAFFSVPSARLVLSTGGSDKVVATATPNNVPPFNAAFQAVLEGGDGEAAAKAVDGTAGSLSVIYDLALSGERQATARVEGDLAAAMSGVPRDAGSDAVADGLRAAEQSGSIRFDIAADDAASAELKQAARDAAFTAAVETATRLHAGPDYGGTKSGSIAAEVTRTEPTKVEIGVRGDVGAWHAPGSPSLVMRI